MERISKQINPVAWERMKAGWERALADGHAIKTDMQVLFPPAGERRPAALDVRYTIGEASYRRTFRYVDEPLGAGFDLSQVPSETISLTIANLIGEALPEDTTQAMVGAEIEDDDNGVTTGRYIPSSDVTGERCFETDYRMYLALAELRRRTRTPAGEAWTTASCELTPGLLTISFQYPNGTTGQVTARLR